jgi:hypothetical protein
VQPVPHPYAWEIKSIDCIHTLTETSSISVPRRREVVIVLCKCRVPQAPGLDTVNKCVCGLETGRILALVPLRPLQQLLGQQQLILQQLGLQQLGHQRLGLQLVRFLFIFNEMKRIIVNFYVYAYPRSRKLCHAPMRGRSSQSIASTH